MPDSPFANLLLPHIAEMEPYTPIQPFEVLSRQLGRAPEQIVKLDANENPYGPAPAVREALAGYPYRTSIPIRSSASCARRWRTTSASRPSTSCRAAAPTS